MQALFRDRQSALPSRWVFLYELVLTRMQFIQIGRHVPEPVWVCAFFKGLAKSYNSMVETKLHTLPYGTITLPHAAGLIFSDGEKTLVADAQTRLQTALLADNNIDLANVPTELRLAYDRSSKASPRFGLPHEVMLKILRLC